MLATLLKYLPATSQHRELQIKTAAGSPTGLAMNLQNVGWMCCPTGRRAAPEVKDLARAVLPDPGMPPLSPSYRQKAVET